MSCWRWLCSGTLALAVYLVAAFSGSELARAGACGDVTISRMNWPSAAIVTAVSEILMEEGYGCRVVAVPSSTLPAVASLAKFGKPDIVTELWVNSATGYDELEADGRVVTLTDVLPDGGREGWWISASLARRHPSLTNIQGVLGSPQRVGGQFHTCPAGWGCRVVNDNLVKAFGMASRLEIVTPESGEALALSLDEAQAEGRPWFGYYWAPTAMLGKHEMVPVELGPFVKEAHACNTTEECATPRPSAYPKSRVITAASAAFVTANPEIAALMSKVAFSNAQMSALLAWQLENEAAPQTAARHFLRTQPDVWQSWVSDDARTKLTRYAR